MAFLLWAGLSCDRVTGVPTTGGIRLVILPNNPTALRSGNDASASSEVYPIGGDPLNIALDGARVTVTGPMTKTVSSNSPSGSSFNITIADLTPGNYTVAVEGLAGGQVAHFGQTTATVTAGADTDAPVTFPVFKPDIAQPLVVDTVEVLRFTVNWQAVTNATSYLVEWSTSPTLASPSSKTVTTTSTEVTVPAEGQYYFAVRAVNPTVSTGGLRSEIKSIIVFQTVTSVAVTPPTPSIVDGATQALTATARDGDNNTVAGVTIFWASSNHSVATVSQAGVVTGVGPGQAVITAIAKGTPGNAALTVTPQAPTRLVFTTPPTNSVAGQSIAAVEVAIQNPKNQTLTTDNTTQITLAIGANPGSGTLAGTATATVVNGVATFNNLSINRSGTGYTLQATSPSLSGTSPTFNVTAGAATQLAFTVQPAATTAGNAISPALQVEVRDALGNRVTSARHDITISLDNDPVGGTLSGTRTISAIDGVASFSGLSLDKAAAGYTVKATATGPTQATSSAFTINPAAVTALAFGTEPVTSSTDDNVVVSVRAVDRFGNVTADAVPVTVSIATNPGGGTLSGTTTVVTSSGTATFNDLEINKVGAGYTLSAQSGALTAATSAAFDMTVGVPAKLGFVNQPAEGEPDGPMTLEVAVQDAGGNLTDVAVDVTLALGVNPGAAILSGVLTVPSVNGVATFADIVIDSTGIGYALDATSTGLTSVRSNAFDVVLNFATVNTGGLQTCGLTTVGSAYCWGWNAAGTIGEDTTAGNYSRNKPVRVAGTNRYFRLATGEATNCALRTSDSTAFCWGWNNDGEVGDGGIAFAVTTPTAVLGGHKFFAISVGQRHTCGIRIADSLAFCWGEQLHGRLGNNVLVTGDVTSPTAVLSADRFQQISAGLEHTCAVRNDGVGFCWGRQLNGRLGNAQVIDASIGIPTAIVGGLTFLQITAGNQHSCGIRAGTTDRRGYCWGNNAFGQLGFTGAETGSPTEVAKSLKYTSLQAGGRATEQFTCGLTVSGTVFCWGSGVDGHLGNGVNTGTFDSPQPLLSPQVFLSVDVATAGGNPGPNVSGHGCGVTTTGVYCWGQNFVNALPALGGFLGDGTVASSSVPVKVKGQR